MLHHRIKATMARTFLLPLEEVPDDAAIGMTAGWDSLGHLELMVSLEEEFQVPISSEAMLELQDLPSIEAYLAARGAGGPA